MSCPPTGPAHCTSHRPGLQHRLQPLPAGEQDRPQPGGHAALNGCRPPAQRRPGPLLQQPELPGGEHLLRCRSTQGTKALSPGLLLPPRGRVPSLSPTRIGPDPSLRSVHTAPNVALLLLRPRPTLRPLNPARSPGLHPEAAWRSPGCCAS